MEPPDCKASHNVTPFLCFRDIKAGNKTEIGLVLHSLLILVRSMPQTLAGNVFFSKFLWQRFNPTFLVYLGLPESSNQTLNSTAKSWSVEALFRSLV